MPCHTDRNGDGGVAVPYEVEVILMRQLASYLVMPIFLVDPEGTLVYFNEPAEQLLGRRYEETGEMPASEWSTVFTPTDEAGAPFPPEDLPLMVALRDGRPAHAAFWIEGLDGTRRHLTVTAFPLIGQHDRHLGAVAVFWGDEVS